MRRTILTLLVIAGSVTIRAQDIGPSTVNAAGGGGIIGTNEFDWSIGEISLVSTFTVGSIVVTQGVLQPFDAWPVDIGTKALLRQLRVFPNPADAVVNIQYASSTEGSLKYQLTDVTGRIVQNGSEGIHAGILNKQLNISLLACATYMLEVTVSSKDGAGESTSFKIEKVH